MFVPLTSMVRKPSVIIVSYTPLDSALAKKSLVGHWQQRREEDGGRDEEGRRREEMGRRERIHSQLRTT